MTAIRKSITSNPNWIALSTDIGTDNKISGASNIGETIYLTDTGATKIIKSDGTLGSYDVSANTKSEYFCQTQNSNSFTITKGALNNLRLRPKILNEHSESSREALGTITSTVAIGQIFKASQDNINGMSMTVQSAEALTSMDDITTGGGELKAGTMEYSSDVALQAEYIKGGANEATRSAFTDIASVTQDGNYGIKMATSSTADNWTVTLASTDLSGDIFSLKFAQTQSFANAKVYFFIGDGTNTKSYPLSVPSINLWKTFTFEETDMVVTADDLTATTPDMSAITKMGFRVDDSHPSSFAYSDSITYQTEPGSFSIELWDLGTTLPTGNGTEDYTSIGTQYTELGDRGISGVVVSSVNVALHGGKRVYHSDDFVAGTALEIPSNTLLDVDHYYSVVGKYVDTDITVYGGNTTFEVDYYTNGYAWKTDVADNFIDKIDGAHGSGAYSDFAFEIYSTQDVNIIKTDIVQDSAAGANAWATINAEDKNMDITSVPAVVQKGGFGRTGMSLDQANRPVFLEKGGKYEVNFNDDATDSLTKILFSMSYWFIKEDANG